MILREYVLVNCAPSLFFSRINCCEESDSSCTGNVGCKRKAPFMARRVGEKTKYLRCRILSVYSSDLIFGNKTRALVAENRFSHGPQAMLAIRSLGLWIQDLCVLDLGSSYSDCMF